METVVHSMIGERLNELRKDRRLTQKELGEILNVNHHSISSYENNKSEPPDDIKIQIAKFFGVSLDYLMGVTDDPQPHIPDRSVLRLPPGFSEQKRRLVELFVRFLETQVADEPRTF
jgi:bacteriophage CI repressor helix-turn-helix domain